MFIGTQADNIRDKVEKSRQARGERIATAKLTEDDIIAIRERRKNGDTFRDIAEDFDVWPTNIFQITKRITWKHVH